MSDRTRKKLELAERAMREREKFEKARKDALDQMKRNLTAQGIFGIKLNPSPYDVQQQKAANLWSAPASQGLINAPDLMNLIGQQAFNALNPSIWAKAVDPWRKELTMATINFGKYAGSDLTDVPREYVEWLRDSRKRDLAEYEAELARRDLVESNAEGMIEKLVQEGFRALAKRCHPDAGGSAAQFHELQAAKAQLDVALAELAKLRTTPAGS